ncbi:MAG: hypothetical protein MUP45_02455 [Candidatus Marinimicrobia bacterium]|nr:hypothetical protein [Candidatus Neomarinimicrobiota bacterium]
MLEIDIKKYYQASLEGFGVEHQPKFIKVSLTDLARVIVVDNPGFLLVQEKREKENIPRTYKPKALNAKAVHAAFALMLFLDKHLLSGKKSPEEQIQEAVQRDLPHQFPSLRKAQLQSTSEFLFREGENLWLTKNEGEKARRARLAFLFERVRHFLLLQESHDDYVFEESPKATVLVAERYDEKWMKEWADLNQGGITSLEHLVEIFTDHLSKMRLYGKGIFSEPSLIQRFYNERRGEIIRAQINGRPDLVVATATFDIQTDHLQFAHWQVYDLKVKRRPLSQTQEYQVDRVQLWLNLRGLSRVSYQTLQKRKKGGAVSIEAAIPPKTPVEGFIIYGKETSPQGMIERVEFSPEEEKDYEYRLYKWLRWFRKQKGFIV